MMQMLKGVREAVNVREAAATALLVTGIATLSVSLTIMDYKAPELGRDMRAFMNPAAPYGPVVKDVVGGPEAETYYVLPSGKRVFYRIDGREIK